MDDPLLSERQRLADLLGGDELEAHASVPEPVNGPVALVLPGDPYLQPGARFGLWRLGHAITLVAEPADNEVEAAELDRLILRAVRVLRDQGLPVQVSGPRRVGTSNGDALAVVITTTTEIRLS